EDMPPESAAMRRHEAIGLGDDDVLHGAAERGARRWRRSSGGLEADKQYVRSSTRPRLAQSRRSGRRPELLHPEHSNSSVTISRSHEAAGNLSLCGCAFSEHPDMTTPARILGCLAALALSAWAAAAPSAGDNFEKHCTDCHGANGKAQ